ncbi:MAG: hypothetical protein WDM92_10125 [Caulobacteraceae bacterium]
MKSGSLLAAAAAVVIALSGSASAAGRIDPARISAHIKVLASDAFEGRGPATRAEPKVIAYVTHQFAAMGVKPGGEKGGWTQAVPLAEFQVTGPIRLALTTNGQPRPSPRATRWWCRPCCRSTTWPSRTRRWCSSAMAWTRPSATGTTSRASTCTARSPWCWSTTRISRTPTPPSSAARP